MNKNKIKFPKNFMKKMKKLKRKKIRNTDITEKIIEQYYNNAKRIL